jgi:hypothetical protein
MTNPVQKFSDFEYSLNEGNSYKKNYGILGPFSPWGYKIKACCPEKGGTPSDSQMIVTGLNEDDENLGLKYIYGENKESDPIYLPKGSFSIEGTPENPVLQTKRYTKWWDNEENQDALDEFVEAYMESKNFPQDLDFDVEGDVSSIIEMLGIDSPVTKVDQKKDLHWNVGLEDGTEVEMKKRDKDNLFRALKFYLSPESYTPEVEINHEKPGYEVIYSTPRGKFLRKCNTVGDISRDPIHKYLFNTSMKKDPSLYQEPVLNYLQAILKGHDWRPQNKRNPEEFASSEKEINQIKKMLLNTMEESVLDEIYSQAREKYSPSSSKEGN